MSVAAAGGAVSTQLHQPTLEQIRLAQLIDDNKHDRKEVQETVRKVLDIVANSNSDDVLLALYDCDYDCEKAVELLIEKGHDVASEWRTATNHKISKKQQLQQQKAAAAKNGHGDVNENGQQHYQQRGNNGQTSRGKSRRFQQNGGDSQNTNNQYQQNDNYIPQQRQRGGNSFRGRYSGNNRGGNRGTDRNYQQQQQQQQTQNQDSNLDDSSPSDTNRRNRGQPGPSGQQQEQWDVGNWNGETLIYSRTTKEEAQSANADQSSKTLNGQSDSNNQAQTSKPDFDPIEAARQIKNVIGIGQTSKPSTSDQQQQQQQQKSKVTGPPSNTKATPPPQARIPQQPVIFTDRFDGGVNKIDVQFGSLDDSSSSSMFYQQQQQSASIPSNKPTQRTTAPEQTAHISPAARPTDHPVMTTQQLQPQRVVPTLLQQQQQQQQSSMTMKPVVTPQYAVHQQQAHQVNGQNLLLQSLLFHRQTPQPELVTLDTSYDPTAFSLPPMDFNLPYIMNAAPQQQQTQARYLMPQPPPPPQQQTTTGTKNVQTPTGSASATSTTAKKGPAVPPGMFPPTGPPSMAQQSAYSAAYGVQQPTVGTTYSAPYDTEHLFANTFMSLNNSQQTQSPTGTYGSVTPPNQQQQQTNNTNDNMTMNYAPPPISENMALLKQYQQFTFQQSNSQQQNQQPGTLGYFLGHPPSGANFSPNHQIMYAQAPTAMPQQQAPKQQNHQYNQTNATTNLNNNNDYYNRNSSSTNKDGQYMYTATNQSQPSTGQQQQQQQHQQQQQGVNKQHQRPGGNVYNNQQGPQRSYE